MGMMANFQKISMDIAIIQLYMSGVLQYKLTAKIQTCMHLGAGCASTKKRSFNRPLTQAERSRKSDNKLKLKPCSVNSERHNLQNTMEGLTQNENNAKL